MEAVIFRMASPVDKGFGRGFRALVFYLPMCANRGLFSADSLWSGGWLRREGRRLRHPTPAGLSFHANSLFNSPARLETH